MTDCHIGSSQTVYVASSIGSISSDGTSIDSPMDNLNNAVKKEKTVLLKAGDTFFVGNLEISGITLSRCGEGANPVLCGYKRIVELRWTEVEKNIWKLNLAENNFTVFDTKGSSTSNNICAFHEYDKDLLQGRKVWHKEEMRADWDYWQTETLKGAKPAEYGYVYLYLTSDPNKQKLEMYVYDLALRVENAVVDGVDFVGFGFGIFAKSHTQIRNCRLDAIGGRIIPGNNSYVCYGNGIEFYVSRTIEDYVVENCDISRCYDCGVTIQGSKNQNARPRNIIIRNNTFVGGIYYCSGAYRKEYKSNVWEGNTCVIKRGDFILSNYGGTKDVIRIPTERGEFRSLKAATGDAIRRYRDLTGDYTTRFVIKSDRRINRRINKLRKQYLAE